MGMRQGLKDFLAGLFSWESILQDYTRSLILSGLGRILMFVFRLDPGGLEYEILFWVLAPVTILMFIGFFRRQPLNRAALKGKIHRLVVGEESPNNIGILVVMSVTNLGAPSIVEEFKIEIKLADGGTIW